MNTNFNLPKISGLAIVLIILFILNLLASLLEKPLLTSIFSPGEYGQYTIAVKTATLAKLTLSYLLNILLAFWLYNEARKQNEKPFIWAAFALFFGLTSVILFYLFILIKEIKKLNYEMQKNRS